MSTLAGIRVLRVRLPHLASRTFRPGLRWCRVSEDKSTDLRMNRELPKDTSFMLPVRFIGMCMAWAIGFCVFVFSYRYYYTYTTVAPMRQRIMTDSEMRELATRDYDSNKDAAHRQRVVSEGLVRPWVPFPFSMWGYRRIPPPTPESRPDGGTGGGV
eukprot:TRINITY_DN4627_c0_g1_i1.p1 TRINITY_DN4627_c0_g1~~TRINITY_DN4627_c0_g1_i1.p1  ORF type:complete len:157 (+),score=4.75 TRINITY_DN4627_c0_g1_i1:94-564(+)